MLNDHDAMATIAVTDLPKAREFYEGTLGLSPSGASSESVATYRSGGSTIVVYESEFARTNRATAATWSVGEDMEATVAALQDAGVSFEHYDLPGMQRNGDVYEIDGFKAAWFRDPDGNILHINNQ